MWEKKHDRLDEKVGAGRLEKPISRKLELGTTVVCSGRGSSARKRQHLGTKGGNNEIRRDNGVGKGEA